MSLSLNTWNISVLLVGYLILLGGGQLLVSPFISQLWKKYLPEMKQYRSLPAIVGVLDRLLYCSAYLLGAKEFIAVWLAVKLAGQWSPAKEDVDRILYHIFLIGNGMNIIISVSIALVIQLCLRP